MNPIKTVIFFLSIALVPIGQAAEPISILVYNKTLQSFETDIHADTPRPIASLTKLITGILVLKQNPTLNCSARIGPDDVDLIKKSSSHLAIGSYLPCQKLFELMLSNSENRAANALARTHFNKPDEFLSQANILFGQLGFNYRSLYDPAGLDPRNQLSAKEYLRIVDYALLSPEITKASLHESVDLGAAFSSNQPLKNTNSLIRDHLVSAIFSKTGYIKESGYNLALVANTDRGILEIIILGAATSQKRSFIAQSIVAGSFHPSVLTVDKKSRPRLTKRIFPRPH